MYDVRITFSRSKDFEQYSVEKMVYTDADGKEMQVSGKDLLTHRFPIRGDLGVLLVCSLEETSTVSWKDIRSITVSEPTEL